MRWNYCESGRPTRSAPNGGLGFHDKPTDMLSHAFGEDTDTLKVIVQKGSDLTSDKEAAKKLLKWIVPSLGLAGEAMRV